MRASNTYFIAQIFIESLFDKIDKNDNSLYFYVWKKYVDEIVNYLLYLCYSPELNLSTEDREKLTKYLPSTVSFLLLLSLL